MAEKLTPEDIIKALECCKPNNDEGCLDCPFNKYSLPECAEMLSKESVDLINRQQAQMKTMLKDLQFRTNQVIEQQAEIEEWKKINQQLANEMEKRRKEDIGIAKGYARIEAIKEFAKRLQEKADDIGIDEDGFLFTISAEWKTWFRVGDWCEEIVDNLVKEMVGDDK